MFVQDQREAEEAAATSTLSLLFDVAAYPIRGLTYKTVRSLLTEHTCT